MAIVGEASFFSSKGRIGRLRYALHVSWLLVLAVVSTGLFLFPIGLFAYCLIGVLSVKRLRDCAFRAAWALLLILPAVNLAMIVFLMFWPEREEEVFEHEKLLDKAMHQGNFKI